MLLQSYELKEKTVAKMMYSNRPSKNHLTVYIILYKSTSLIAKAQYLATSLGLVTLASPKREN